MLWREIHRGVAAIRALIVPSEGAYVHDSPTPSLFFPDSGDLRMLISEDGLLHSDQKSRI